MSAQFSLRSDFEISFQIPIKFGVTSSLMPICTLMWNLLKKCILMWKFQSLLVVLYLKLFLSFMLFFDARNCCNATSDCMETPHRHSFYLNNTEVHVSSSYGAENYAFLQYI